VPYQHQHQALKSRRLRLSTRMRAAVIAPEQRYAGESTQPISAVAPSSKFNFIEVFAGIGGMTLGLLDASSDSVSTFIPRLLVDIDSEARAVFIRNFPDIRYLCADVHTLSGDEIRARAGMAAGEVLHVLAGGPPCQGFSGLGSRALDDERNVHVVDFLRLVKELKPLVAVMENVPQVITSHGGAVIKEVCETLSRLGYSSCADILWASDYGVPQLRKRAFVIAYKEELGVVPEFPARTHERVPFARELIRADGRRRYDTARRPYVSVEEAIGDLPLITSGGGDEVMFYSTPPQNDYQAWARKGTVAVFNHRSRAHSEKYLKKISVIQEGGRNVELPKAERFSENYYSQAYARLHRSGIAQTVTTYFGNPGSGRFMHFQEVRSITVREAARFQSFPDTFVFGGHQGTQMRHVGNAVPPLLARAIRDQVAADLRSLAVGKRSVETKLYDSPESREQRSKTMRAVPSKNTSIELGLRKALRKAGVKGYRLHVKGVPGTPDILFQKSRLAIFVDGCFWHGCKKCYREPGANKDYWRIKVQRNRDRDAMVTAACKEAGWRVLRIWEHQTTSDLDRLVVRIQRLLKISSDKVRTRARK
jgi:DNA (cytosine-5)-methyltransferase 1